MDPDLLRHMRKLSQQYAYTSIQMHEAIGRRAGLSGTDHKYLGFLLEKGAMSAGELSALTGLSTGAVTGLIDRFEKKGLVSRRFATEDRRKVMIEPHTQKIMALLQPLYQAFRSESERLIASLSKEEISIIGSYFSRAIEVMQTTIDQLSHAAPQK